MSLSKIIFALLLISVPTLASADEDYRSQVESGIVTAENAIVSSLQTFQPPLNADSMFCFSFEMKFRAIDLDSLSRILRDKDAEAILPQIEKPRQAEVRAALGSGAYAVILKSLDDSVLAKGKMLCHSSKDQASLKNGLIAIFAELVKSHSAIQNDDAAIYAAVDRANVLGLLSPQEIVRLKQMALE